MTRPLESLRIVEFAGIGPAPFCGMMFADMGADVILIDRAEANPNAAAVSSRAGGADADITGRGKRSIALDLRSDEGRRTALAVVGTADGLIEGFRPGVMERLGLGPEICHAANPRLVYGRMTGWGQTGPLSAAAGHDPNYIGVSGALSPGAIRRQAPTSPLTLVGDVGGGAMVLAWGMMCALHRAAASGRGCVIDAAITDGSAYISSLLWSLKAAGGMSDPAGTRWIDGGAPWNGVYQCADGQYITICALEPMFYRALVARLGLGKDPVFENQWDRSQWPRGHRILTDLFAARSQAQWRELLEGSDVCFGPVLDLETAPSHPHNVARGTFIERMGILQPAPAPVIDGERPDVGPAPTPGQHTSEILNELGLEANT